MKAIITIEKTNGTVWVEVTDFNELGALTERLEKSGTDFNLEFARK